MYDTTEHAMYIDIYIYMVYMYDMIVIMMMITENSC